MNKLKNKSVTHNTFRIQDNESIMYGYNRIYARRKNLIKLY